MKNKKKSIVFIISAILILSMFAACSNNNNNSKTETEPLQSTSATVIFTDSAGREVEIPTNITKISPSGALSQMFLLAIAPDLLVTIPSAYSEERLHYIPESVGKLPVVGQFYGTADLNVESIAAIGPEIVIDIGEPKKTVVDDMNSITETTGIPAIHITASLNSTADAFRTLGELLGREEQGEALAQYCENARKQTDGIMEKVGDNKATVVYCLGDSGTNVLAANTFHTEILDYLTNNIAVVDQPTPLGSGNETDMEQLLLWDPEVILFAPNSVYATAGSNAVWQQLQAIQNGNYYEVPYGPYNWTGDPPSINRFLGMQWLTKLLYPEYADFDLYESTVQYYKLFYHYEMSREKFDELTMNLF